LEISKVNIDDLESVINIYKDAIQNMILNKIFQWDEIYPNKSIL
jgi:hypothetical protein